MRNTWIFIAGVVILLTGLTGCKTIRTYDVEKPRIDMDIEGNRGFLIGEPTAEVTANRLGKTRKISVLEIELPESRNAKAASATSARSNQTEMEEAMIPSQPFYDYDQEADYVEEIAVDKPQQKTEAYIVQKNDTLQKISLKFYGTTKKWKYLYDVNKNVIKNPDKLYPGMKLSIPSLK